MNTEKDLEQPRICRYIAVSSLSSITTSKYFFIFFPNIFFGLIRSYKREIHTFFTIRSDYILKLCGETVCRFELTNAARVEPFVDEFILYFAQIFLSIQLTFPRLNKVFTTFECWLLGVKVFIRPRTWPAPAAYFGTLNPVIVIGSYIK